MPSLSEGQAGTLWSFLPSQHLSRQHSNLPCYVIVSCNIVNRSFAEISVTIASTTCDGRENAYTCGLAQLFSSPCNPTTQSRQLHRNHSHRRRHVMASLPNLLSPREEIHEAAREGRCPFSLFLLSPPPLIPTPLTSDRRKGRTAPPRQPKTGPEAGRGRTAAAALGGDGEPARDRGTTARTHAAALRPGRARRQRLDAAHDGCVVARRRGAGWPAACLWRHR